MTQENGELRQTLYKLLTGAQHGVGFSLDDIRTICFALGMPFDNLKGDTVPVKAMALIEYLEGRDRLPDLAELVYRQRESSHPHLQSYYDTQPAAAGWRYAHVYSEQENFTGRAEERALLERMK